MTYTEILGDITVEKVEVSGRIRQIATIQLMTEIPYKIASLFLNFDAIEKIFDDLDGQYEAINSFVSLVRKTMIDSLVYIGVSHNYTNRIKSFLILNIWDYIEKGRLYSIIKEKMLDDKILKDDIIITAYIARYIDKVIASCRTLNIDINQSVPTVIDIKYEYKNINNYKGWLIYKSLGNNVLVLLEI